MATIEEQIEEVEDEIFKTSKNKATEHHIGKLKAKVAKLKAQLELHKMKSSGGGKGYYVKKSGDATVSLVGFPSVGKSSILNALTGKEVEIAAYCFTTLEVIPGILDYKGAKIQILDMPGIIRGASRGKGRGKEVITAARASDIIIIAGDVYNYRLDVIEKELYDAAIRINMNPPDIHFSKAEKGGIVVRSTVELTKMTEKEAAEILRAYGVVNGVIVFREDVNPDQLVDFLAGNRVYIPAIYLINKMDLEYKGISKKINKLIDGDFFPTSVKNKKGLDELKDLLYDRLGFIRIFMKPQGGTADMEDPMVLLDGATIGTVCEHLHRDFVRLFRYGLVWGKSAKYPGQSVGLKHVLEDEDVVSMIIRRM